MHYVCMYVTSISKIKYMVYIMMLASPQQYHQLMQFSDWKKSLWMLEGHDARSPSLLEGLNAGKKLLKTLIQTLFDSSTKTGGHNQNSVFDETLQNE